MFSFVRQWLKVRVCACMHAYRARYFPWLTEPLMSFPARQVSTVSDFMCGQAAFLCGWLGAIKVPFFFFFFFSPMLHFPFMIIYNVPTLKRLIRPQSAIIVNWWHRRGYFLLSPPAGILKSKWLCRRRVLVAALLFYFARAYQIVQGQNNKRHFPSCSAKEGGEPLNVFKRYILPLREMQIHRLSSNRSPFCMCYLWACATTK